VNDFGNFHQWGGLYQRDQENFALFTGQIAVKFLAV